MVVSGIYKYTYDPTQVVFALTTSFGGEGGFHTNTWASDREALYYSFADQHYDPATSTEKFTAMSAGMQLKAALAFRLWDDLISLSLSPTTGAADISFNYARKTVGGGSYTDLFASSANYSYNNYNLTLANSRVWLNSRDPAQDQDSDIGLGGFGFQTYMHEIGHALGLSHPAVYDASDRVPPTYADNAVYTTDNRQHTVMSYFGGYADGAWQQDGSLPSYLYSSTPMVDDIAAIQWKYGADYTTRNGNTVYGFNSNLGSADPERSIYDFGLSPQSIFTIWDGGGTDTLDGSGYSGNQTISLAAGSYSSMAGMAGNVGIAYGANIEIGIGGSGADTLYGGLLDEQLFGGAGDDLLVGGQGADRLTGGAGADVFNYTLGPTYWYATPFDHQDTITDYERGVDKIDLRLLPAYTPLIVERLANGDGQLKWSYLSEQKRYGQQIHVLGGVPDGDDILTSAPLWIIGSASADLLKGGALSDTLVGGAGPDTLTGGAGADVFLYQTFADSSVARPDVITNFETGIDKIDLVALGLTGLDQVTIQINAGDGGSLLIDKDKNGVADAQIVLSRGSIAGSDLILAPNGAVEPPKEKLPNTPAAGPMALQGDFTVAAGETLNIANPKDHRGLVNFAGSSAVLDVLGSVVVTDSADASLVGYSTDTFGQAGVMHIHGGGVFSVTGAAPNGAVMGLFGVSALLNEGTLLAKGSYFTRAVAAFGVRVDNRGTISTTDAVLAIGVTFAEGQGGGAIPRDFSFHNTGLIEAEGRWSAVGVLMVGREFHGILFDNDGIIRAASGDTPLASAALQWDNLSSATTSYGEVQFTNTTINTGTLQGEFAYYVNPDASSPATSSFDTLINNGVIEGRVAVGLGHDTIHNSGLLTGLVELGAGDDFYEGAQGNQTGGIDGGDGDDTILFGGTWAETVYGGRGEDSIVGGAGDDFIDGGRDDDQLDGGGGFNTVSYRDSFLGIDADLQTGLVVETGIDTIANFQRLLGSAFNDRIQGSSGAEWLEGRGGDDVINGRGGVDTIIGGRGDDSLTGGAGAQTFVYSAGDGHDTIVGFDAASGDLLDLFGHVAGEVQLAQLGEDALVTLSSSESVLLKDVRVSALAGAIVFGAGALPVEIARVPVTPAAPLTYFAGSSGADTMAAGSNGWLDGLGGDDHLQAGAAGTLAGGAGDDVLSLSYESGSGTVLFNAGDGHDTVLWFRTSAQTRIFVQGYAADQAIISQQGDDTLIWMSASDSILLKGVIASQINDEAITFVAPNARFDTLSPSLPSSVFGDFTIYAGESYSAHRASGIHIRQGNDFVANAAAPPLILNNSGRLEVQFYVLAMPVEGVVLDDHVLFTNTATGALGVISEATESRAYGVSLRGSGDKVFNSGSIDVQAVHTAWGIDGSFYGVDVDNSGALSVSGQVTATGVAMTQLGGWTVANSGVIDARGGEATGVSLGDNTLVNSGLITARGVGAATGVAFGARQTAGFFTNTGVIHATSNAGQAIGVSRDTRWFDKGPGSAKPYDSNFRNAGTILAESGLGAPRSIGVLISGNALFDGTFYNTGTITADIAIKLLPYLDSPETYVDLYTLKVENNGQMAGDVLLQNAPGRVMNNGAIIGDIYFGRGNDQYAGALGSLTGTVFGGSGNDSLSGGSGDDVFDGGSGNDRLIGGAGTDTAAYGSSLAGVTVSLAIIDVAQNTAGAGLDTLSSIENLSGTVFADRLTGSGGDNTLSGLAGDDTLEGGAGADVLAGGAGADTLDGGLDYDMADYSVALGGVSVDTRITGPQDTLGDGIDTLVSIEALRGSAFADTLTGGYRARLEGGGGDDRLTGGSGYSALFGGEGNDTLVDGVGEAGLGDVLDGGAGFDIADFSVGPEGVEVDLQVESAQAIGAGRTVTLTGIEGLVGTNLVDILSGGDEASFLSGGRGNDILEGRGGADSLLGGGGNDTLIGGAGDDSLDGGGAIDAANFSGLRSDYVTADLGGGILRVTDLRPGSPDGVDTLVLVEFLHFSDQTVAAASIRSGVTIIGTPGADTVSAIKTVLGQPLPTAGGDIIYGLGGNDSLDGAGGEDAIYGGPGNDTFVVDDPGDHAIEAAGEGKDAVKASVTFTLSANVEDLTLTGSAAINGTGNGGDNKLTGNAAANVLYGLGGTDKLDGGAGADMLYGGDGNDTYVVDNAGDQVFENAGEGNDTVQSAVTFILGDNIEALTLTGSAAINGTGNGLANKLTGNGAANILTGGAGADTLSAGLGDDTLIGGTGKDKLTGGGGADTFVFGPAIAADADSITDFGHGVDHLAFRAADYGLATGPLAAANLVFGAAAVDAHAEFVYDAAKKTLLWDADGVGGAAAVAVTTFSTAVTLTASDFLILA